MNINGFLLRLFPLFDLPVFNFPGLKDLNEVPHLLIPRVNHERWQPEIRVLLLVQIFYTAN